MAKLKKNAVNQILFTMVDATDFATMEQALAASNFGVKRFGVNRGSAAASISTLSRIVSVVGSGVYRLSLEAATCNYDYLMLRITCSGAAPQMLAFEMATAADDDISDYLSKISDFHASVVVSKLSGISDILSKVYVQTTVAASGASLIPGMSNILSAVYVNTASIMADTVYISGIVSGIYASTASAVWAHVKGASALSLLSQLRVRADYSTVSDLTSKIAKIVWDSPYSNFVVASTFGSALGGRTSIASDIASAVWAHAQGASVVNRVSQIKAYAIGASNILSNIFVDTADISNIVSGMSNILSAVYVDTADISNIASQIKVQTDKIAGMSDILSAVYVDTADISNIVSKVYVQTTNNNSYLKSVLTSKISGISDILSQVRVHVAVASSGASLIPGMSDILSKVYVQTTGLATASNIASAVWGQKWDVHSVASTFGSAFAKIFESGVPIDDSHMSQLRSAITLGPAAADTTSIAKAVWAMSYSLYGSNASSYGSLIRVLKTNIPGPVATSAYLSDVGSYLSNYISSIHSNLYNYVSDVYSLVSDVQSAVAAAATASDVASKVWVHAMAAGYSAAGTVLSNIISKIAAGPTTGVTVQNVSDIASRVWSEKWDVHSVASSFGSLFEQLYKRVSYLSNTVSGMSDILSKVYVDTTDISDVVSKVFKYNSGMSNILSNVFVDTTDISNILSQVKVQTDKIAGMSDILSAVYVDTADISNMASDLKSFIASAMSGVDMYSKVVKLASRITVPVATQSKLGVVESHASLAYARSSKVYSMVISSDYKSNIASVVWGESISGLKGVAASFGSRFAKLTTSDALSKAQSDINSHISGLTVNAVTASDISDIVSAVWGASISTLKGVAASFGSRYAKLTTSDALSKAQSSIESHISKATSIINSHVSGVTAVVSSDAMSTIASMVWAEAWDIHSNAGSFGSAFEVMMSGVDSAASAAVQANSRTEQVKSRTSDISSQVWAGDISGLKTVAGSFGSRYAKLATSDGLSKAQSSINSHVSGITAVVDEAGIVSLVWAHGKATSTLAYGKVAASGASLIPGMSDILSKVYVQTTSMTSDIISMISTVSATYALNVSMSSDIISMLSTVSQLRVRANYSTASDFASVIATAVWDRKYDAHSTVSTFGSAIEAITSRVSDIGSQVWAAKYTANSAASTFGSLMSAIMSATQAGGLTSDAMSTIASMVWAASWDVNSVAGSFGSMFEVMASNVSDVHSAVLNSFVDGTTLTTNSLRDRIRTMGWVLRNRLVVTDASGDAILYKDDGATSAFKVTAQFTDTGTITTRKRYE